MSCFYWDFWQGSLWKGLQIQNKQMLYGYSYLGDLYYTIVGQNILATVTNSLMLYSPLPLGQCNNKKDCYSLVSQVQGVKSSIETLAWFVCTSLLSMVLRWHFTNVNTTFDALFFIETYDKDHYEKVFRYKRTNDRWLLLYRWFILQYCCILATVAKSSMLYWTGLLQWR